MSRSNALLLAGYALAVPPLLRGSRVVRSRNVLVFWGGIELGTALVAAGWALKGRRIPAMVNGVSAAVVLPAWWVRGGRAARATA